MSAGSAELPPPAGRGEPPCPRRGWGLRWGGGLRNEEGGRRCRDVSLAAVTRAGGRERSGPGTGCLGGVTGPGGDGADASGGRLQPAPGPLPVRQLGPTPGAELVPGILLSVRAGLGGGGERGKPGGAQWWQCRACSSCQV